MRKITDKEALQLRDEFMVCRGSYSNGYYIDYKGKNIEHYNDYEQFEDIAEIKILIERCLHIESLGLIATCSTVIWQWSRFEQLTTECKYLHLLAHIGDIYHRTGKVFYIPIAHSKYNLAIVKNGIVKRYLNVEYGDTGRYHFFTKRGCKMLNIGQGKNNGQIYATTNQFIKFFDKNNIPVNLAKGA